MRQFLINNDMAFRDLEERARWACTRFRSQEMPLGSVPKYADIGFEISENPYAVKLFVDKEIQYNGSCSEIRNWFQTGVIQFSDFTALRSWLSGPLRQAFNGETEQDFGAHPVLRETAIDITDMAVVHEGIRDIHRPLYLDESVLFERLNQRILGQVDALKGLSAVMARHLARRQIGRAHV